ncbi:TPA: hypothetical protein I7791_21295 [Vibrio vulnificus]|nr:hypothetical protein [Vibrio vulnificus]
MLVGCEFHWFKVWKGQVNRGCRFCCWFPAFKFSVTKAKLSLQICISWLWKFRLKSSPICDS